MGDRRGLARLSPKLVAPRPVFRDLCRKKDVEGVAASGSASHREEGGLGSVDQLRKLSERKPTPPPLPKTNSRGHFGVCGCDLFRRPTKGACPAGLGEKRMPPLHGRPSPVRGGGVTPTVRLCEPWDQESVPGSLLFPGPAPEAGRRNGGQGRAGVVAAPSRRTGLGKGVGMDWAALAIPRLSEHRRGLYSAAPQGGWASRAFFVPRFVET